MHHLLGLYGQEIKEHQAKSKVKSSSSTKRPAEGCPLWGKQGHRGLGIHEEIITEVPGKVSSPVQE